MSRQVTRVCLLNKRNQLNEVLRAKNSDKISEQIFSLLAISDVSIGLYLGTGSEVDLSSLVNKLFASDRTIYVPRIVSKTAMNWCLLSSWEDCIEGRFGIQTSAREEEMEITHLDVLVMPCVGFDRQLNRIGMGGGFYDRALQGLGLEKQPRRIGVAFSIQETLEIEQENWDIPFHVVVTEVEIILP